MRPVRVRIGRASFELPGEYTPLLIGALLLLLSKLGHMVLRLLFHQ